MNSNRISVPRRIGWFFRVHAEIFAWVFHYIVATRAWFLAPMLILLMAIGLLIFVSSNPAVSPFLYALF